MSGDGVQRAAGGETAERDEATRSAARVLIVDDERAVGAVLGRMLKSMSVTFSQSAAGALGRIAAGGHYSAIVCDLRMPGMDGLQFFDEVAKLDARLARRIVFVTGAGSDSRFEAFLERTGCAYLPKPVDGEALRAAVAAAGSAAAG